MHAVAHIALFAGRAPAIVVPIVHSRFLPLWMAGAPGFEPGMRESKSRALTSWLRPNMTLDNYALTYVDLTSMMG